MDFNEAKQTLLGLGFQLHESENNLLVASRPIQIVVKPATGTITKSYEVPPNVQDRHEPYIGGTIAARQIQINTDTLVIRVSGVESVQFILPYIEQIDYPNRKIEYSSNVSAYLDQLQNNAFLPIASFAMLVAAAICGQNVVQLLTDHPLSALFRILFGLIGVVFPFIIVVKSHEFLRVRSLIHTGRLLNLNRSESGQYLAYLLRQQDKTSVFNWYQAGLTSVKMGDIFYDIETQQKFVAITGDNFGLVALPIDDHNRISGPIPISRFPNRQVKILRF